MHKYQPRVHIVKKRECVSAAAAAAAAFNTEYELRSLDAKQFRTFIFPETVFIGVTAYQNQLVSTILILLNISLNIFNCEFGNDLLCRANCNKIFF